MTRHAVRVLAFVLRPSALHAQTEWHADLNCGLGTGVLGAVRRSRDRHRSERGGRGGLAPRWMRRPAPPRSTRWGSRCWWEPLWADSRCATPSSDNGETWSEVVGGEYGTEFVRALAIDPRLPGHVIAGTFNRGALRSQDDGRTWQRVVAGGNWLSSQMVTPRRWGG